METFINDLLSQMTLEEKIGQLNQLGASIYGPVSDQKFAEMIEKGQVGSFLSITGAKKLNEMQRIAMTKARLKIPLLFAADIIHGSQTIFPTPLAESCSWNPEIARKTAEAAAFESTATGLKWTFAPMVDIGRDARWGRVIEGAGEDPYLGSLFAAARVKGFQGELKDGKIDELHIAACAKHFACYGAAESGKDYNNVQLSEYNINNVYLPPFKSALDAGVLSYMTAFNDINGTPCTTSYWLNYEVLRQKWGFDGILVSDWQALPQVINHGYACDNDECVVEAAKCSMDIDMAGELYLKHTQKLVENGTIPMSQIDEMVRHILIVKYKLGLFDNPYADENRESDLMCDKMMQVGLESAQNSIVLLKNDGILPLKPKTKVLLVGDLASNKVEMQGNWANRGTAYKTVTIQEGLSEHYEVEYINGFKLDNMEHGFIERTYIASKKADVIIAVVGESLFESGEARCKTDVALRPLHCKIIDELSKMDKPLVTLLVNGRPLAIGNEAAKSDAVVECWQLGTMAGKGIANVISGKFNPQGKLTISVPRATGQCPIYYSPFSTGRPYDPNNFYTSHYLDCAEGALYPFGYGLTYSDISLEKPQISTNKAKESQEISIKIKATNNSKIEGTETVQLYMRDLFSKPVRPIKELLRFSKVTLKGGESKEITLTFNTNDLGHYHGPAIDKKLQKGTFKFYIGLDSVNCQEIDFEVV